MPLAGGAVCGCCQLPAPGHGGHRPPSGRARALRDLSRRDRRAHRWGRSAAVRRARVQRVLDLRRAQPRVRARSMGFWPRMRGRGPKSSLAAPQGQRSRSVRALGKSQARAPSTALRNRAPCRLPRRAGRAPPRSPATGPGRIPAGSPGMAWQPEGLHRLCSISTPADHTSALIEASARAVRQKSPRRTAVLLPTADTCALRRPPDTKRRGRLHTTEFLGVAAENALGVTAHDSVSATAGCGEGGLLRAALEEGLEAIARQPLLCATRQDECAIATPKRPRALRLRAVTRLPRLVRSRVGRAYYLRVTDGVTVPRGAQQQRCGQSTDQGGVMHIASRARTYHAPC